MSGERSGFTPKSQLAYDSGSRNGPPPVVDNSRARRREMIPPEPITAEAIVSGIIAQAQAGRALGRLRRWGEWLTPLHFLRGVAALN